MDMGERQNLKGDDCPAAFPYLAPDPQFHKDLSAFLNRKLRYLIRSDRGHSHYKSPTPKCSYKNLTQGSSGNTYHMLEHIHVTRHPYFSKIKLQMLENDNNI